MMVANSSNLIITVRPANQRAAPHDAAAHDATPHDAAAHDAHTPPADHDDDRCDPLET